MTTDSIQMVAYISHAAVPPAERAQVLREMTETGRARNANGDITAALFLRGSVFFQFMEGPIDSIKKAMHEIKADPRHTAVRVIMNEPTTERRFPEWPLECFHDPKCTDDILSAFQKIGLAFTKAGEFSPSVLVNYVWHLVAEMAGHRLLQPIPVGASQPRYDPPLLNGS